MRRLYIFTYIFLCTYHSTIVNDVIVVGAGPVGIFAATQAAAQGMMVKVIAEHAGGQARNVCPTRRFRNIAGHGSITGIVLMQELTKQAHASNLQAENFIYDEIVTEIKELGGKFVLTTEDKRNFMAKYIILAIGCGLQPKKPELENLFILEQSGHVQYYLYDLRQDSRGCGR